MTALHARRAVARYVADGLGPRAERRMRAHLSRCPRCRDFYAACLVAERALVPATGPDGAPVWERGGPREVARAQVRLLREVAAAEPPPPASARVRRRVFAFAAAVMATGAAAVLAVVFNGPWREAPPLRVPLGGHEYTLRGFADTTQAAAGLALRLVCVAGSDHPDADRALRFTARELRDGDRCGAADVLFLVYSNLRAELTHLYVFGIDGRGALQRYYPRPDEHQSIAIASDDVDRTLGRGIVLGRAHPAGPLRVVALFTPRPVGAPDVEAAALALRRRAADPADAAAWRDALALAPQGGFVVVRTLEVGGGP